MRHANGLTESTLQALRFFYFFWGGGFCSATRFLREFLVFLSEGCGCLEEGCLGLRGVLPDIFELRFSRGNEGKDGKNLSSQTWPGEVPDVFVPDIRNHPILG